MPHDAPDPADTADWSRATTFVPMDPPRASVFACWIPDADGGMFAADAGSRHEMMVRRGDRVVREDVDSLDVPIGKALAALSVVDERVASPSSTFWSTVVGAALDLVSRGHLIPAVTAGGWDAWRVDPLEPADHALVEALAAACPPEAHALAAAGGVAAVSDPAWLVRAAFDAVADTLVRTAAAPRALGSPVLAAVEATPAAPLRQWVAAAYGHLTSPTCLGLRVEVEGNEFAVAPQLRSSQDPSLVVDAAAVVGGDADVNATLSGRLGGDVFGALLVGLSRAATIWPVLDRVLDDAVPARLPVSLDEIDSLLDATPRLEAAGVEVLWPAAIVTELRTRLVATAAPTAVASGGLVGLDALLDFRWQVLLDDRALAADELDALADAKRRLVWLRDRWVRVDEHLAGRLRRLPAGTAGPSGLAAALAGELVDEDGFVVEVVADGFVELLRSRLGELAGVREEPEPVGLVATLRPYQRRGLGWMLDLCRSGLGGVLADDMGLGKTVQVIALHLALRGESERGESERGEPEQGAPGHRGPTLVVCPTSVLGNWAREIGRFAPDVAVRTLSGADRHLNGLADDEMVLVTYGVMRRMVDELAEIEWRLVVADEAQHIESPWSRTARAIRRVPAATRLALTGTPVENRLSELWSLLDWTTPGLLGSSEHFRTEFAVPIERHGDRHRSARLALLTRAFMLRRRKTDPGVADDLPPRTHHDVVTPLSDEQMTMYEAMVRESMFRIRCSEGADRTGMVFRLLTALKQIANHPGQYLRETDGALGGRSGKLDATLELVAAAIDGDERVLVFSQYVTMCRMLERRFAEVGISVEVLHGGLPAAARDEMVDRFQAGGIGVLIVSLKAGGTGLNLTAATQVVHFDRWWNPAVEDQATDRAWRIGQTRPVVVHRMIAEGTIDERIAEMIEAKRGLADRIVGGGETWIADLDDDELTELVRLRSGASTFRDGVLL